MKIRKDYGLIIFALVAFIVPIGGSILTGFDFEPFGVGYYTGVVVMLIVGSFLENESKR